MRTEPAKSALRPIIAARRLLRNPAIAGLIRGTDGALIEATHPSIVEREKWG